MMFPRTLPNGFFLCLVFILMAIVEVHYWKSTENSKINLKPQQHFNKNEAEKHLGPAITGLTNLFSDKTPLNVGTKLRRCIYESSSKDLWKDFVPVVTSCVTKFAKLEPNKKSFITFRTQYFDELKYFLPLEVGPKKFNCFWMTIGIGGDSKAEKEFKEKYPECRVYGVEAGTKEQHGQFPTYGTVIPVAVGVKQDELVLAVRSLKGNYESRKVPVKPLTELLDENLHQRLVHFVTLDIEGFEYPLLREFQSGGAFEKAGVAFCVLDVELHSPKLKMKFPGGIQNFTVWDVFMREFLRLSPYVPIYSADFLFHHKATMVNPTVPECVRVFDMEKYQLQ